MTHLRPAVTLATLVSLWGQTLGAQELVRSLPAPAHAEVVIDAAPASIHVSAWDRDSLLVQTDRGAGLEAVVSTPSAERIDVIVRRDGPADTRRGTRDTVFVQVPRGASVSARSYWGAVHVVDVVGRVAIETYFEPATYEGEARELSVTGFHAAIEIDAPRGQIITASSGGGDVAIRAGGGEVSVETVRGDVTVRSTAPLEGVDLVSTSGSIRFEAPFSAGARVNLRTHGGDVVVGLARDADVRLSLETYLGSIENEFGASSARRSGPVSRQLVELDLGRPGARLSAKSFRGDIRVIAR